MPPSAPPWCGNKSLVIAYKSPGTIDSRVCDMRNLSPSQLLSSAAQSSPQVRSWPGTESEKFTWKKISSHNLKWNRDNLVATKWVSLLNVHGNYSLLCILLTLTLSLSQYAIYAPFPLLCQTRQQPAELVGRNDNTEMFPASDACTETCSMTWSGIASRWKNHNNCHKKLIF